MLPPFPSLSSLSSLSTSSSISSLSDLKDVIDDLNPSASSSGKPNNEQTFAPEESFCYDNNFLNFCSFCKTKISQTSNVFMYRGDAPFCSEGCRNRQIERDDMEEKIRNISLRMEVSAWNQQQKIQQQKQKNDITGCFILGNTIVA